MSAPTTIVIADDHQLFIDGLRGILESDGAFRVVGTATSGTAALALVHLHLPQIALLDIHMPPPNGLDLGRAIKQLPVPPKVAILSMNQSPSLTQRIKGLGLDGFLVKNTGSAELRIALLHIAACGKWFPRMTNMQPIDEEDITLTVREHEVLRGIALGKSSQAMAEQLSISVRTVETHRKNINQKLGTTKVSELLVAAQRRGWV